jgi:hypothetical protein
MSKISSIHDAMITRLAAVLSSHRRLANPYQLPRNITLNLNQGYGVAMGGATGTRRLGSYLQLAREFRVSITREVFALDEAADAHAIYHKDLLEDQLLVIKDFEINSTLNDTAIMVAYQSDSGVSFVDTDKGSIASLETTFLVTYQEDLNA